MEQQELIGYAKQRRELKTEAYALRGKIQAIENERATIRRDIKLAVASETGPDGKAVFSNEDKRRAESDRRESEHAVLQGIGAKIDQLYADINEAENDASYLSDMIRIGCAFAGSEE